MMPMDPFFTSQVKDDSVEKMDERKAYAKALQLKRFVSKLPKKNAVAVLKSATTDASAARCARALRGSVIRLEGPGRPSITGFKSPRKKWTEERK